MIETYIISTKKFRIRIFVGTIIPPGKSAFRKSIMKKWHEIQHMIFSQENYCRVGKFSLGWQPWARCAGAARRTSVASRWRRGLRVSYLLLEYYIIINDFYRYGEKLQIKKTYERAIDLWIVTTSLYILKREVPGSIPRQNGPVSNWLGLVLWKATVAAGYYPIDKDVPTDKWLTFRSDAV